MWPVLLALATLGAAPVRTGLALTPLDRVALRQDAFVVTVEQDGRTLARGRLQVSRMTDASLAVELSVPAAGACRPIGLSRSDTLRVEIRLHKFGGRTNELDTYQLSAVARGVVANPGCAGTVRREASADRILGLRRGQGVALLESDGLVVRLQRR